MTCSDCSAEKVFAAGMCCACYHRAWRAGKRVRQKPATLTEIKRMKALAEAGMPSGSIGIALGVDFGRPRSPEAVRYYLHTYCGWKGKQRGEVPKRGSAAG